MSEILWEDLKFPDESDCKNNFSIHLDVGRIRSRTMVFRMVIRNANHSNIVTTNIAESRLAPVISSLRKLGTPTYSWCILN